MLNMSVKESHPVVNGEYVRQEKTSHAVGLVCLDSLLLSWTQWHRAALKIFSEMLRCNFRAFSNVPVPGSKHSEQWISLMTMVPLKEKLIYAQSAVVHSRVIHSSPTFLSPNQLNSLHECKCDHWLGLIVAVVIPEINLKKNDRIHSSPFSFRSVGLVLPSPPHVLWTPGEIERQGQGQSQSSG